jgi:hypothetical protein
MTLRRYLSGLLTWHRRGGFAPTGGAHPWAPRAPRITVEPLHDIACRLTLAGTSVSVPVVNVSISGVALRRDGIAEWPPLGARIPAELDIVGTTHPVSLELVHFTGAIAGCAFREPSDTLVLAIECHFAVELEAADVVSVQVAGDAAADVRTRWYRGRSNCGLYYTKRGGAIEHFALTFLGNYLEGGAMRPIRFGIVAGDIALIGDAASAVRWLQAIDAEQLTAALRFVKRIRALDPADRDAIVELIC